MLDTFNYSVDMVRLYTEVKFFNFQKIMDNLVYNPYCKYREMKQITAYRHNFYISGMLQNHYYFVTYHLYKNYVYKQLFVSFLYIYSMDYIRDYPLFFGN